MFVTSPSATSVPRAVLPAPAGVFAGQNHALHQLLSGAPLEVIFSSLVQTLEADIDGQAVGAILVLDAEGRRLRHGAAPTLPDAYNRAVDGIEIGAHIGTCAAAAARNEIVITRDIDHDPGWAAFKHLPLGLGLVAAWSMPIRGANGEVLGTFGTYFRERRVPTPVECELVSVLANTAALAIEHRATQEALQEEEAFAHGVVSASTDCIKVLDLEGRLQWVSDNGLCAMEIADFAKFKDQLWVDIWRDPVTRAQARQAVASALAGGLGRFQGFCATMRGAPRWWDVVVSPIRGEDKQSRALLAVSRDITEVKEGEAALKLSERLQLANRQLSAEVVERRQAETDRLRLSRQLAGAEESERCRISRELHDGIGQQLTALSLGLSSLGPHLGEALQPKLRSLADIASRIGKEVHDLALALRPPGLDEFGLEKALRHYLQEWSRTSGVRADFRPGRSLPRLAMAVETAIYRLVQEALNNVAKHAAARKVAVAIESCPDHVLVVIEDDGCGFNQTTLEATASGRLGLRNMRERAFGLGGAVNIESQPGGGTTVFARIPVEAAP